MIEITQTESMYHGQTTLMQCQACGHNHINDLGSDDQGETTFTPRPCDEIRWGGADGGFDVGRTLQTWERSDIVGVCGCKGAPGSAEDRWIAYLDALDTRQLASGDVAAAAKRLWARIRDAITTPPDASPSNSGGLLMSWDRHGLHLEIEILADTSYEWFFRQRSLDVSEGDDGFSVDEDIPEGLQHRLNQICIK